MTRIYLLTVQCASQGGPEKYLGLSTRGDEGNHPQIRTSKSNKKEGSESTSRVVTWEMGCGGIIRTLHFVIDECILGEECGSEPPVATT